MRLLILLILFPFLSQGQVIRANPYYRPSVAGCSYLLDQYSGAAAAYSLRKLDCDYAGSAIRVRRSSDNTEQDIGFTSGGDLDTAALKTFVGTGGTDDGAVVKWYNQGSGGSTYDAAQSTSDNQPLIMDNGVVLRKLTKPFIKFDGSNDYLEIPDGADVRYGTGDFMIFAVTNVETPKLAGGDQNTIISKDYLGFEMAQYNSVINADLGQNQVYVGGASNPIRTAQGTWITTDVFIASLKRVGSTCNSYVNATASSNVTNSASATNSGVNILIGNRTGQTYYINGSMAEIILSSNSATHSDMRTSINTYYSVY